MYVQAVIRDEHGKIIKTTRKRLCKSYVRAMIDKLHAVCGDSNDTFTDTGNASRVLDFAYSGANALLGKVDAGSTDDLFGVQVGTGTGAVTINDYALGTKVLHGTTSGKLAYGAVSLGAVSIVSSTAQFTISRTFTNSSGADIDVKEVGLVCKFSTTAPLTFYVLIERTLLSFTVANGTSGTVTYTLSVSV